MPYTAVRQCVWTDGRPSGLPLPVLGLEQDMGLGMAHRYRSVHGEIMGLCRQQAYLMLLSQLTGTERGPVA